MDISDADMIAASDRGERIYRAKRAQETFRRSYRAPATKRPFIPRAPAYAARFPRDAVGGRLYSRSMPRAEIKSFDLSPGDAEQVGVTSVAGTEPAAFATGMTEINDVQAGNAFYQRIGTKINIRSIMMRFKLTNSTVIATGLYTTEPAHVRYMVVYDRQPNGAFPAITDILQNNDSGVVTHGSSINIANRDRFSVLLDRNVTLSEADTQTRWVSDYLVCPNLQTQFRSSAATIGDITTGSLLFISFASIQLGPAFDAGQIQQLQFRIRYADT